MENLLDDDATDALSETAANLNEVMKSYHQFVDASPVSSNAPTGVDDAVARQIQLEKLKRERQIEEGQVFRTN